MIRASGLNLSQVCGHASVLSTQNPQRSSYSATGDAFHAGAAALDAPICSADAARLVYDQCLQALSVENRRDVMAMVKRWVLWRKANLPEVGLYVEVEMALDEHGLLCDTKAPGALVMHADLMWKEDHTDIGGGTVAKVLDHKTGLQLHTPHPDENLQLAAYGVAGMQILGCSGYQVGLVYHSPREEPRVVWGEPSPDPDRAWERIRAAATKDDLPVTGPHCEGCFVRVYCRAWMLPAMESGPEALEPFTKAGDLTQEAALKALTLLKAWEDVGRKARARLEDFARRHPIVHGNQEWGPSLQKGRMTIDADAAKGAGLYNELVACGAVKQGKEFETFRWRTRR